ncbi:MAG: bacillithiol system redox-active protein YtxJ [Salibacteraceae bacterium]
MNWRKLTSITEFDEILMQSSVEGSAFILFKHSTRCMVSTMALRSFESEFQSSIPAYFVDLIKNRDLSNYISKTVNVIHQSPQVITIKNGEVVYSDSHHSISAHQASVL